MPEEPSFQAPAIQSTGIDPADAPTTATEGANDAYVTGIGGMVAVDLPVGASGMSVLGSDPNNRSKSYADAAKADSGFDVQAYRTLVTICRNIYKDEGLITRYVDLHEGMASLGIENHYGTDVDKSRNAIAFDDWKSRVNEGPEGTRFISKQKGLAELEKKFCYEWNTSGLVVSVEKWGTMKMTGPGGSNFSYEVPVEIDFFNPLLLNLDKLYTENAVYYDLPQAVQEDIKLNGLKASFLQIYDEKVQKPKGSKENPNPYIPKSRSDILKMINDDGLTSVPLPTEKVRVRRRSFSDYDTYPIPMLSSCLVALSDKSLLREANRSVLSKIINQILMYKVGQYNPANGQKTNVQDGLLQMAADRFGQALAGSGDNRLVGLFTPETHDLGWIAPDSGGILNDEQYRVANIELLSALVGFPAWSIVSTSGQVDTETLMKMIWTQHDLFTSVFIDWVREIYQAIITRNNMRFNLDKVSIQPRRISLLETEMFTTFYAKLVDKGQVSLRSAYGQIGVNFDTEVANLIEEKNLRDEFGVFLPPPTFSQTVSDPGDGGNNSQKSKGESGKSGGSPSDTPKGKDKTVASPTSPGRPTGSTDS